MSGNFSFDIIKTPEEMLICRNVWRELEATSLPSPFFETTKRTIRECEPFLVFQSFDWCMNWIKTFGDQGDSILRILVIRQDNVPVLIFPLMRSSTGPLRLLRWLGDPFGQYGDILTRDPRESEKWLTYAWDLLTRQSDIDIIRLRHVRETAHIHSFLQKKCSQIIIEDGAPFMDFSAFSSAENFEERFDKKQRQRRKKIRKRLEEIGAGTLSFSVLKDQDISIEDFKDALHEKRAWLNRMGFFSQAIEDQRLELFLKSLAEHPEKTCHILISTLRAGDKKLSWEIALEYRGVHYCFITAHDCMLTEESPARLHMDYSQNTAFQDDMTVFDLLIPSDEHKRKRSNGVAYLNDFYCPVSWAGYAIGHSYYKIARPLMQKIYYAASPRTRKFLATLLPKQRQTD